MEVIINNCTGVGMRARLCTLYGVYIYARQGRKRRTIVLLRCEKLNHKQRVAHNNKQYSCVLTMMMWHSAELWIGCCSCFCCCWWTMKYTATPDIKPNQNWTKHNCHWEHTIIIEVQRKDGTLRKRIHTDRQKTITAAAAASKDKKNMIQRWMNTRAVKIMKCEEMEKRNEKTATKAKNSRADFGHNANWTQRIFDGFVCNLFIYCVLSIIWHCDACKRLSLSCGPFYLISHPGEALNKPKREKESNVMSASHLICRSGSFFRLYMYIPHVAFAFALRFAQNSSRQ